MSGLSGSGKKVVRRKKANASVKKSGLKIGFVMDPIADIKPQKDSTLAMMLAAQRMGASLFYMEQDDLFIKDDVVSGIARPVRVTDDPDGWYTAAAPETVNLATLDAVMMRKDPPVDKRFLHCCAMLAHAGQRGARVFNRPEALMLHNEKLLAARFPQFCPPYVVTSSLAVLRDFLDKHRKIIIKPLDAMGGSGIFMVEKSDVNFEVIWEMHTGRGAYPVEAQKFIPAIRNGDKRVIVIDGKPFSHTLARLPKAGSVRGNLAAGGSYEVRPITTREREIATAVGKVMVAEGIVFAGLDVIGDYLTEVNITSPTCLREISKATGVDLGRKVIECVIKRIKP